MGPEAPVRLQDIIVVLSRPSESGNVGAVCRAMKNMGISRLRIVAPEVPLDDAVIKARAVHAADVYEAALRFETLREALTDCAVAVATTRRRGKKRKDISVPPEELAEALKTRNGPAALVFGNERTGLEEDEIALCNLASHIPVDEVFPSLNLSHAVQVYCYCLFRTLGGTAAYGPAWEPIPAAALDELVKAVADSLKSIGFYKQAGRLGQEAFFRDVFARAGLTQSEARFMEKIFRKTARLATEGAGPRRRMVDNTDEGEHT